MRGLPLLFLFLSLTVFRSVPALAQGAADSLYKEQALVLAMRDSLELGIRQIESAWGRTEREQSDSLKYIFQRGLAEAWKDWAMKAAPRRGMSGEDILRLADLHAWLNRFEMDGCYEEQLTCYKRAMVMPGCEERALRRLHTEWVEIGYSIGMIQTGQQLLLLDKEESMEQGVALAIAKGYYIVGDRKEAMRWVKRHLRHHPEDVVAQDLKRRIRKTHKQPD